MVVILFQNALQWLHILVYNISTHLYHVSVLQEDRREKTSVRQYSVEQRLVEQELS